MKWPQEQIAIIESAFQQVLANCGTDLATLRQQYAAEPPLKLAYDIYCVVWFELQYDDTHPQFQDGHYSDGTPRKARRRLVRYDPAYQTYPAGCDDTHRKTVIRYLAKQHGLMD